MIERQHLQIIASIHERGSLTAAAKSLNLTQSALSHTIRKFETINEVRIFRKQGRGIALTPAGQKILKLAQRVLPQLERCETQLIRQGQKQQGTLRIGMECHPCHQWLMSRIGPYLNAFPGIDIDIRQRFQFGGVGALYNYEIDVLITPDPFYQNALIYHPVKNYQLVAVLPKSSPMSQKGFLKPEDFRHTTLLTYPVPPERLDIFSLFLTPARQAPKAHKTFEATEMLLHMIAAGRGVGALPDWLVANALQKLGLVALPLGEAGITKTTYCCTRLEDQGVDFINAFLDMAQERPVTEAKKQLSLSSIILKS